MPARIPDEFASQLAALIEPADLDRSGRILEDAVDELDDDQLGDFMASLAARVGQAGAPLRAMELQALLDAAREIAD